MKAIYIYIYIYIVCNSSIKKPIEKKIEEQSVNQNGSIPNKSISEDDGWFSGLFPSYMKKKSFFNNKIDDKDKAVVKSNEPILVEKPVSRGKLKFWNKLFLNSDSFIHGDF